MLKIDVVTLFPGNLYDVLQSGIIKNAQKSGALQVNLISLRKYGRDKHQSVDDNPYGGGAGMVLGVEPFYKCLRDLLGCEPEKKAPDQKVLMTGPDGCVYNQRLALELAKEQQIVLLCGHFKGIDERVREYVDGTVSIGDYVLTGGELPALVIIDSIARLLPGAVSDYESVSSDSHYEGLLGAPVYTRPAAFRGYEVPEVLLSGNHKLISEWRFLESVKKTAEKRPDLWSQYPLDESQKKLLSKYKMGKLIEERKSDHGFDPAIK